MYIETLYDQIEEEYDLHDQKSYCFLIKLLSYRPAFASGEEAAVPFLPSEIGEIHGAFVFALPALDLCVSGTVCMLHSAALTE